MSFDAIESYKAELRAAGNDPELLKMSAQGAISHARMVEGELLEARSLLARMEMNLDGQSEKVLQFIHERDEAREARDQAKQERDAALKANVCDACGGSGIPVSGPGCMCGGSGKMSDAAFYLRERYAAEKIRADNLQNQLNCWLADVDANRKVKIPSLESENMELRAQLAEAKRGAVSDEAEVCEARSLLTRMEINLNEQTEKIVRLIGERDAVRHSRDAAQKVTDAALIQLGKVGKALRDLLVVLESHDIVYRDVDEAMKKAKALLLPPEEP
jgi:hypothetical protein